MSCKGYVCPPVHSKILIKHLISPGIPCISPQMSSQYMCPINIYTPSLHLALTQVSLSPPVSCFSITKYADVIAMGYCFLARSWTNSGNWDPRGISEISPSEWLAELLKITDRHNSSEDYCNIGENIPEQVITIYSNSLKMFPIYNSVYLI